MTGAHASGEVVLITGASSGLGLLTAFELARRGLRVFASMRDASRRAPVEAAARAAGIEVEVVELDVTRPATIAAALADIRARAGGVDILINNAGIGLIGAFEDTDEGELRKLFETNFFGLGAVTRAVIPEMRVRGRGRIVNVTSMGGRIGAPGAAAYTASKFAVEGLSEALSHELAPFGIDVVIIEPGAFATELIGPQKRRWSTRAGDPASPYRALCSAIDRSMQRGFERGQPDPNAAAVAIARAATAMRPRLRYPVGSDAQVLSVLRELLPARRFERVFRWLFHRTMSRD